MSTLKKVKTDVRLIPLEKLVSSDMNVRFSKDKPTYGMSIDTYDLPTMIEQIKFAGRILKKLTVRERDDGNFDVIVGNRRTRAAQKIKADPSSPQQLVEAISYLECEIFPKTMTAEDIVDAMNDHGDVKRLTKVDIVKSIWQMDDAGFKEAEIAIKKLYDLASFTGNERKINTLPQETALREKEIKQWFHATLGSVILKVKYMTEEVKDAYMQTKAMEDGLLPKDFKRLFDCTPNRIKALATAQSEDRSKGEWNAQKGGPKYNELLQKIIQEDTAPKGAKIADPRMALDELQKRQESCRSLATRAAYTIAAGGKVEEMLMIDTEAARIEGILNTMRRYIDLIGDPKIKQFFAATLHKTEPEFVLWCDEIVEEERKAAERIQQEIEARKQAEEEARKQAEEEARKPGRKKLV